MDEKRPPTTRTLSGKRVPAPKVRVPARIGGRFGQTEEAYQVADWDGAPSGKVKRQRRAARKVAKASRRRNRGQR